MTTKIIKIDQNNIDKTAISEASELLKEGKLVVFPTETVYGIGANALDNEAILNIYKAKGRPSDNPLIVHIANIKDVYKYVKFVPDIALKLMERFWPGPLTLIFEKSSIISNSITGGLNTVAVRLPANKIARELIKASDLPIAAPSANISGKPSPTRAKHVIEDLNGLVDMIIDGGNSEIGLESTVLDITGKIPIILRPGGITKEMLEKEIGQVKTDAALLKEKKDVAPKSPGMKYKHYAPKGILTIVFGEDNKAIDFINKSILEKEAKGIKVGVISTYEDRNMFTCQNVETIGSITNEEEIASNLFAILRLMDEKEVEYIFTRAFSENNIGLATMNRLLKASGNHRVYL